MLLCTKTMLPMLYRNEENFRSGKVKTDAQTSGN